MNIRVQLSAIAAALLLGWSAGSAQPDTITIIHINDTHTDLVPYAGGHLGGVARAASVIGQWKATQPNPVLIHAGDFSIGSLMYNTYFGVADLQIFNNLGFDALCLGNHEFDPGSDQLAQVLQSAGVDTTFHFVCSNALNLSAVPSLDSIVKPCAIITRGRLKIGIAGLTTPATNIESSPAPVFLDTNVVQDAMAEVLEMRNEGCNIVLLVTHLGIALDMQIAPYLSGVDAIIGGHSHDALKAPVVVNGIPIVQAGAFFHYVGRLRLIYNGGVTQVLDDTLAEITDATPADPTTEATVEQLKQGVSDKYRAILGEPYVPFRSLSSHLAYLPTSILAPKSPLGDTLTITTFGADSVQYLHPDCALEATGHMSDDLYAGNLTPADVFRAYPYGYNDADGLGFRLASFELQGAEILGILQGLLPYIHPEVNDYEYLIQSTGLDYVIDTTGGTLTLVSAAIGGQPIKPDSTYRIVGSDRLMGYLPVLFGITPGNPRVYNIAVVKLLLDRFKLVTAVKPAGTKPVGFRLDQNFPNPFNPSTRIDFSLPRSGFVSVKVYDILGRTVATLVEGEMTAGAHTATWHAQGIASGVYFLQLISGKNTALRKMLLLK